MADEEGLRWNWWEKMAFVGTGLAVALCGMVVIICIWMSDLERRDGWTEVSSGIWQREESVIVERHDDGTVILLYDGAIHYRVVLEEGKEDGSSPLLDP